MKDPTKLKPKQATHLDLFLDQCLLLYNKYAFCYNDIKAHIFGFLMMNTLFRSAQSYVMYSTIVSMYTIVYKCACLYVCACACVCAFNNTTLLIKKVTV